MKTYPTFRRKIHGWTSLGVVGLVLPAVAMVAQPRRDGFSAPPVVAPPPFQGHDPFYWLGEMNKASTVMLTEEGIVSKQLGAKIAATVLQVIADGAKPGATRPSDYLVVEEALIAIGGPDVTRIHSGRSRQDLGATSSRLMLRDATLVAFERFIEAREVLLRLAERHPNAVIPFYTNGVQAQPTTFGHYLGGFLAAFTRGSDRYKEVWSRLNLSSLGNGAGGTSSFALNRHRLAELLGFDGLVVNAFDSGHISPLDLGVEFASTTSAGALTIGMLVEDIAVQYSFPHPWLLLEDGEFTGGSSIMPQKRNPFGLTRLRQTASVVLGETVSYLIQAHNVRTGMADWRSAPLGVVNSSARMYREFGSLMKAMKFDEAQALDEVNSEYSVMTELADILQRDADVPFRVGHHFAADLVKYGRSQKIRAVEIPFGEARRIYTESSKFFKIGHDQLPLGEAQFRKALTPENMVQSAKVIGGPQSAEVARMLDVEKARLAADREWLNFTRAKLEDAAKKLDAAVAKIMRPR